MKATINLRKVQAVCIAAAIDQTRYYLNGVYIAATPKRIEYVATNGHFMLADCTENDGDLRGSWIIPAGVCKKFKITKRADPHGTLESLGSLKLRITYAGEAFEFSAVDAAYPDFRRVIPRKVSHDIAQFDARFLAALEKAARIQQVVRPGEISIAHNGNGPALASWANGATPDFFAVITPYRAHDAALPGWLDAKDEEATEAPELERAAC